MTDEIYGKCLITETLEDVRVIDEIARIQIAVNVWDTETCPHCGETELDYDLVVEEDDSHHDIIDCPSCHRRLYYED